MTKEELKIALLKIRAENRYEKFIIDQNFIDRCVDNMIGEIIEQYKNRVIMGSSSEIVIGMASLCHFSRSVSSEEADGIYRQIAPTMKQKLDDLDIKYKVSEYELSETSCSTYIDIAIEEIDKFIHLDRIGVLV